MVSDATKELLDEETLEVKPPAATFLETRVLSTLWFPVS